MRLLNSRLSDFFFSQRQVLLNSRNRTRLQLDFLEDRTTPDVGTPQDLTADVVDHTSVVLTWVDASYDGDLSAGDFNYNEEGFYIERYDSTNGWAFVDYTLSDVTTSTDPSLFLNETYSYRIAAYQSYDGYSNFSNLASVTTPRRGTFLDADLDIITVKITGPGQVGVIQSGADGSGPIDRIVLTGTDPAKSRLSVTIKKDPAGDGRVSIGAIEGTGVKSITATAADLTGLGINLTGSLGSLKIHDIHAGAKIAASGNPIQNTSIKAHEIGDNVTFNLGTHISSFTAAAMGAGSINAPSIGKLTIKGDANNKVGTVLTPIVGHFEADLTLSGTGDPKKPIALGTAHIAGDVIDPDWNVTGGIRAISAKNWNGGSITAASIGKLSIKENFTGDVTLSGFGILAGKPVLRSATVGRTVEGSTIQVAGTVSNFRTGEFVNSSLLVGYTPANPGDPFAGGSFLAGAKLTSFRVLGIKNVTDPAFENSLVAATSFGTASLKSIDTMNASKFGLLADLGIESLTVTTPALILKNVGISPILNPDVFGDFEVRVI